MGSRDDGIRDAKRNLLCVAEQRLICEAIVYGDANGGGSHVEGHLKRVRWDIAPNSPSRRSHGEQQRRAAPTSSRASMEPNT